MIQRTCARWSSQRRRRCGWIERADPAIAYRAVVRHLIRSFALALVAAAVLSGGAGVEPVAAATCGGSSRWWECASGSIEGGEAVLRGDAGNSVGDGSPSGSSAGGTGATPDGGDGVCTDGMPLGTGACDWLQPRDDYDVVLVTMNDIARFRPSPPRQAMQPDGWAVVGLPSNLFAAASAQVVAGELLGAPAEVRFTPIAFRWRYGDGDAATLRTPGGSWAALGLREFDRTETSHVYRETGRYTVRLDVAYSAEYRIEEGPFIRIPGTLMVSASDLQVIAGSAKTVLVDRDCARNPTGPGC